MKLSSVLTASLAGVVNGVKFMEVDLLAAQGMFNLNLDIKENGYLNPKACTLENAAVRREWFVVYTLNSVLSLTPNIGQLCLETKSLTTLERSTALPSYLQRPQLVLLLAQKAVTMIWWSHTFSRRITFTEL